MDANSKQIDRTDYAPNFVKVGSVLVSACPCVHVCVRVCVLQSVQKNKARGLKLHTGCPRKHDTF